MFYNVVVVTIIIIIIIIIIINFIGILSVQVSLFLHMILITSHCLARLVASVWVVELIRKHVISSHCWGSILFKRVFSKT